MMSHLRLNDAYPVALRKAYQIVCLWIYISCDESNGYYRLTCFGVPKSSETGLHTTTLKKPANSFHKNTTFISASVVWSR